MKKTLLVYLFLISTVTFAQKEANNWYFGHNAGVTFNSGAPVALTNGQLYTLEGCSSISDASGNLLFYTDGIKVWNRNHAVMANGSNLKGDPSSTQSGIIVPKPGSTTVYYIFTVDMQGGQALFAGGDADGASNGFMYSEVDMTLNGGLGDVVVARKNVLLKKPTTEGLSAVKQANGTDYWVVTHGCNNNQYYAFSVTAAGVNTVPVQSNVGPNVTVSAGNYGSGAIGYTKISPNGKKIAACHAYENNQLVISDFNTATGVVSNAVTIGLKLNGNSQGPYGVEFSNCNEYVYVTELFEGFDGFWGTYWPLQTNIWRFDPNAASIPATKTLFRQVNNEMLGALQLAVDGKIYMTRIVRTGGSTFDYNYGFGNSLHAINNPRLPGATFTASAVSTAGRATAYGLPPFIASFFYNSSFSPVNLSSGSGTLFCKPDNIQFNGSTNVYDSLRWYFGDPASGILNTSTILNPQHLFSAPGTYYIQFYKYLCGFKDSAVKTITIYQMPVINNIIDQSICAGSVTLDATGSPVTSYSWSNGAVTPTITVSTPGKYVVTASNNGCIVKDSAVLTVAPPVPVSVTASPSVNNICQGTSVTLTASPTNGGSTPAYQWYVNGNPVGLNSNTYTSTTLNNNDQVTVRLTSNATCITGNPATSAAVAMIVNAPLPVSVTASPSVNNICQGTSVTFTASPTNGGAAPAYQWYVNGNPVGLNSNTYTSTTLNNNDQVTVRLTNNATCVSGNPATSAPVAMVVNTPLPVSVTASPSVNNICQGTSVTFTASPTNGGAAPAYQWYVNGNPVGLNSNTYTSTTLNNNDQVTVRLTSNATCVSGNPATSAPVAMVVNTPLPVSVIASPSVNNICQGTSVTLTATPTNGGGTPAYQWYVNGSPVGLNSNTYISTTLNNNDQVTVRLTSNATCISGNPATSAAVSMVINPILPVSVTASPSANNICQGTSVTFTATPTNGGAVPAYQWYVNGNPVGANSNTYTSTTFNNNDQVTVRLTSNATCVSGNPATSVPVGMVVTTPLPVSVTASPSINNICQGTSVTLTATPTNGGAVPAYQWYVNGNPVGSNSNTYTSTTFNNNDQVTVQLTSNASCVSGNPATSAAVAILVTSPLPVSVTASPSVNNICQGTSVTFTATPTNGGAAPAYQWYVNGNPVGLNSNTYTSTTLNNNDQVTVRLTSNAACISGNPATSGAVAMLINPLLPVSVSASPSANNICQGTSVTFTATPTNGGTTPAYQWYVNGNPVGANSNTYTSTAFNNNDQVTVRLTSNEACTSGNPATSTPVAMVVNTPLPVSVTASPSVNNICQGTSVTLTATPTNGGAVPAYQWFVNGNPVGANSNTYTSTTFNNNDQVTVQLTSNASCVSGNPATSAAVAILVTSPLPVSVTASPSVNNICQGTSVTFSATPTNGGALPAYQWYVNGNPVGVNSNTYSSTTLNNNDQVTVQLTSNASCVSGNPAISAPVVMTVNPLLPVSVTASPSVNNICQGTSVTFTATPTNGGAAPAYQWYVNGNPVGLNSNTYTSTTLNNNDQVTVQLTSNAACISGNPATSAPVAMTVNPILPVSVTASPSANNICQGTSVTFTATPTNGGAAPAYQWYVNGNPVGGNSNTYTSTAFNNNDQVTVKLTSNAACVSGNPATSAPVAMVVNTPLPVSVTASPSINNICQGTSVTLTATPTNGGAIPAYQWYVNGNPVGGNSNTYTSTTLNNNDQVKVQLTSNLSCVSGNPATSSAVAMVVNPILPVSVTASPSTNNICQGTSVTFTATPTNGGTAPAYQWYVNGNPVGTNSNTYTSTTLNNNDQVTVRLTSNEACTSGNPATSAAVAMVVNPILPVSVTTSPSANNICQGTSVTFTATPTNGGAAPAYQWYVNGNPVGANSNTYSSITFNNNDQVTVRLTSNAACVSGNPATSAPVAMTVNTPLPVSVTASPSINNICQGTSVTLTATPTNGGAVPAYQWFVNGNPVGGNSNIYTSTILNNNDQVTVQLTSNLSCVSGNPGTSAAVAMVVNPILPVSVTASPSINNICQGTSVTFTATPTNGGTAPAYQWYVNGNPVGTNSNTYSSTTLNNNDQVTVRLTSNETCVSGNPATSAAVAMVVNPILPVSVTASPSANNICQGTSVTLTATPTNGGAAPVYQWYVNGNPVGGNSNIYTSTAFNNNDQVTVQLTSNALCPSGNPALSAPVAMIVNTPLPVSVTASPDINNICQGMSVTLTATPINGGATPAYQWYVNGNPVGANSNTYTSTTFNNNDQVTVQLTSNATCISGNPATSAAVVITVTTPLPVSVTASPSINNICQGTSVTFTATPTNGGAAPAYQWYVNGSAVGLNSNTYTSTTLNNNDQVTVRLTSNAACISGNPATSAPVAMTVNPLLPVSVTTSPSANNICQGTSVTFTATPTNGGALPAYQWYVNGNPVGGNSNTYTSTAFNNSDQVTVRLTSNALCPSGNPATSSAVAMVVNTPVPVSVTALSSANNICQGTSVTLTATPTNGGALPAYQWYVNGNPVGTNSNTYTSTTFNNNDQVKVQLTSSLTCVSGNPSTSTPVAMVVNTPLPVSVTTSPSANNICQGTSVSFTATPTNGGAAPAYQWYVNGNPVGTNSNTYASSTLNNSDQVTVRLTSNASCISGNPTTSAPVAMTVNPLLPVSVTTSPSANNICQGTGVTFTATPTNGGSAPAYQWYVNGNPVGINSNTYSSTAFNNNDQVTVKLTSNEVCKSGNPATSAPVAMTVNTPVPVSVTAASNLNNICQGTSVTLTATPTNGGAAPAYQWYVNGNPVGTNSNTYTSTALNNNDQVTVRLTSNATCITGNPALSTGVSMTVKTPLPVSVTASPSVNDVCQGTSSTITATPINGGVSSYQWYVNGNPVGANSASYSAIFNNNDQVTVQLTSNLSCVSGNPSTSVPVAMMINAIPVANAGRDTTLTCSTKSLLIGSASIAGNTYSWSPITGLDDPAKAQPTCDSDISYTLTVTSNKGCKATDVINVRRNITTSAAIAGADKILTCKDTTFVIGAPNDTNNTYLWSPSIGLDDITLANPIVSEPGNYVVTVTKKATGCTSFDNVSISKDITPPLANAGPDKFITCVTKSVVIGTATITGNTYSWVPTIGLNNSKVAQPAADSAITYAVTVKSTANGCTASDSVTVQMDTVTPLANAGPDQIFDCPHVGLVLGTPEQSNTAYHWTAAHGLSAIDVAQPVTDSAGTFAVYVVNTVNGCRSLTDSVVIEPKNCTCEFYVPSAFTPNNDGLNDMLYAFKNCDDYRNFNFSVFNRWGELVFSSKDLTSGWDGFFRSESQQIDSYAWVITYFDVLYNETRLQKGTVVLLR